MRRFQLLAELWQAKFKEHNSSRAQPNFEAAQPFLDGTVKGTVKATDNSAFLNKAADTSA